MPHLLRRALIRFFALAGTWVFAVGAFAQNPSAELSGIPRAGADAPNILLILAEDIGPDLACYGTPLVRTPNLDAIAARLTDALLAVGDAPERLAPKTVIDWLNGRAKGFKTIDGNEEVVATAWATGKVGMTGTSYNGTLPVAAATTGVKGLEAIIPDKDLSINEGAFVPLGEAREAFVFKQVQMLARRHKIELNKPVKELPHRSSGFPPQG